GMHHLPHPVVELDFSRYVASLADRQELLQIVPARIEECQRKIAGLIARVNLVWCANPMGRRRPMAIDRDGNGNYGIDGRVAQFPPCAAINRPAWDVK